MMSRSLLQRALLVLLLAAQLSGCGVKLMYNNLDRFARWNMSDYVDLNDEQRAYFDAEVDALLYWHRTHQLPEYADLLETLPTTFSNGADLAEILWISDRMFVWYEQLEARLVHIAVEIMLSLEEEQVAELPRRLERDNEELEEEYPWQMACCNPIAVLCGWCSCPQCGRGRTPPCHPARRANRSQKIQSFALGYRVGKKNQT